MSLAAEQTFWTPEQARAITGGTLLARVGDGLQEHKKNLSVTGVNLDSRTIEPGQVFFAIKGPRFDGHDHVGQAMSRGAAMVIIERGEAFERTMLEGIAHQVTVLLVGSTRHALLQLAQAYRRTLPRTRVIAVAGSNGKTTTVRLIEAALAGAGVQRGTASQKSFNNDIGVPLTILRASPLDQFLICEVGTNAPGEIQPLSHVIAPDIVVLTSLGREHLEGLTDLAGVASEEAALVSGLGTGPNSGLGSNLAPGLTAGTGGATGGGVVIVPADAPLLVEAVQTRLTRGLGTARARAAAEMAHQILTFGRAEETSALPDVRVESIEETLETREDGSVVPLLSFALSDKTRYRVPLLGEHNAMNAAAATIVARRCGLSPAQIAEGLLTVRPAPMRMELSRHGGVTFVNDAYNANPESMLAALATFARLAPTLRNGRAGRTIAVLGEMRELGEAGPGAHREIAQAAQASGIAHLVLVGELFRRPAMELRAGGAIVEWYAQMSSHAHDIASRLDAGDCVLVKGSRSMAMEQVITLMSERSPSASPPRDTAQRLAASMP